MREKTQALLVVPLIVGCLTTVFIALGYVIIGGSGLPHRLAMPVAVQGAGVLLIALGLLFAVWLFLYRSPSTFLVSTYVTMRNAARRKSGHQAMVRTETLILTGPHRHVRHPIYFAAVMQLLGWWLVLGYTLILLLAIFFFLWFTLVVIRFEEMELRSLFGEEYEEYARSVPMIFPSIKPRWPARHDAG